MRNINILDKQQYILYDKCFCHQNQIFIKFFASAIKQYFRIWKIIFNTMEMIFFKMQYYVCLFHSLIIVQRWDFQVDAENYKEMQILNDFFITGVTL